MLHLPYIVWIKDVRISRSTSRHTILGEMWFCCRVGAVTVLVSELVALALLDVVAVTGVGVLSSSSSPPYGMSSLDSLSYHCRFEESPVSSVCLSVCCLDDV